MADAYVGNKARQLDISPEFAAYSRVVVYTGEQDANGNDIYIGKGSSTGRTLEFTNPWMTSTIATAIVNRIKGWSYQPYNAKGASLNPAAEIGDSVQVQDVFSGIYSRNLNFTSLYKPDLSAPYDEEIDHEYSYETQEERRYTRKFNDMSASIAITNSNVTIMASTISSYGSQIASLQTTASAISAVVASTVSRVGKVETGKLDSKYENQSFGWSLNSTAFSLNNNNTEVFRFDANGLKFKSNGQNVFTVTRTGGLTVKGSGEFSGKITASSGTIGGFNIGDSKIYNNLTKFKGTQSTGVYIGIDGIQLGQNFRVDNYGNMVVGNEKFKITSAGNVEITGKVTATSGTIGGFTIGQRSIYNNNHTWSNPKDTGVYIGDMGIKLGKKFSVDAQGNLKASSGTFDGYVYAKNIQYGTASTGTIPGAAITSGSIATPSPGGSSPLSSGVLDSLGYADFSNGVFNGSKIAQNIECNWLHANKDIHISGDFILDNKFTFKEESVEWKSTTVVTGVSYSPQFIAVNNIYGTQTNVLTTGTDIIVGTETIYYLG